MADFMEYIRADLTPAVKARQDLERRITDEVVKALFAKGFVVRVWDGEAFCTKRIQDPVAVQKAVQTTDEDILYVYREHINECFGTIYLVYGNDGFDVVSDWSTQLDGIVQPIVSKYNA